MYWFLIIIFGLLSLIVSGMVKSSFKKYSKVANSSGMSGAEIAQMMSDKYGLDVQIGVSSRGTLSDHYDPRTRSINLSPEVYQGRSIAAAAVASHEMGHAIQHAQGYQALTLRNKIAPIVSIASGLWFYVFLIGSSMAIRSGNTTLMWIGLALFAMVVAFQLITLPVEFDASNRALNNLQTENVVSSDQVGGARKMLRHAALTYVIAALASLAQLAYLVLGSRRR